MLVVQERLELHKLQFEDFEPSYQVVGISSLALEVRLIGFQ